ncbi:hypothetical protein NEUTE1DRAFT_141268 [Neurospora tetrasperma FGSC 2508]|uniref:Uncharacterized protein n=1 Tax=Neurospora tetrasperma (strain FGSC 2508 / ATCC MYA-4615 / P0657) TaxID=510951 RepID=F8MXY6_NEUT8|nr:uncharacterized protein NEUTE1DRAFT_141268 [Neurospora tetrasperma FGSC 2508]EGO53837.1 hypothetical protein NEUTE1DRAFT_141268 [Neurospora tetrasperma FGSC 2508]
MSSAGPPYIFLVGWVPALTVIDRGTLATRHPVPHILLGVVIPTIGMGPEIR